MLVSFGPGLSTNIEIVVNEGDNSNTGTLWNYVATILSGQIVYTTFTENTNFAKVPIKFAPPPFTKTNFVTMEQSFISGFETNTLPQPTNQFWVDYPQGSIVDGWEVASNQVAIVTDTNIAVSGTNFLALGDGVIRRTLPTVGGHTYRLVYITRDPGVVSWWPGVLMGNTAVDVFNRNNGIVTNLPTVTTNTAPGKIDDAFYFNINPLSGILLPDNGSLRMTNSFTIEGWINTFSNFYYTESVIFGCSHNSMFTYRNWF